MATTIVRMYDSFDTAENAREALLNSGFGATGVQLTSNQDEAGPVQGNFVIGNGNRTDESYAANYAGAAYHSAYMITVDVASSEEQIHAAEILDSYGATNVDRRTRR